MQAVDSNRLCGSCKWLVGKREEEAAGCLFFLAENGLVARFELARHTLFIELISSTTSFVWALGYGFGWVSFLSDGSKPVPCQNSCGMVRFFGFPIQPLSTSI